MAGCVRFTPLQRERERERGAVVLCVFSVSERASVKVGKRLHTSQVQRLKESERERETERKSELQKQIVWEKNTIKGERGQKTDPVPEETQKS